MTGPLEGGDVWGTASEAERRTPHGASPPSSGPTTSLPGPLEPEASYQQQAEDDLAAHQESLFGPTIENSILPQVGRFHHDGHDTERAAAEAVAPKTGSQRARVLDHLRAQGEHGSTDYEAGAATRMFRHVAGTRRKELIAHGWPITDSGRRRKTDTGNSAIVWVLAQ